MSETYKVGSAIPSWGPANTQTITFVVTEDCNLRCKYCYITHKSTNNRMSYSVAKEFIDFILSSESPMTADAVIIEFIGGEPFLEIELIDKISDYFKLRAYELNHPWYWNYRFNFSTNGITYGNPDVQRYISKNNGKLSIGITIDGTQEKHDLQRVYPNNRGSYLDIAKNIPLYITQFCPGTKVTFASDDLKYLKDSIVHLWSIGITEVSANVVFEDVWKEGDDFLFENQLKELADYIIKSKLYNDVYCSLFDDSIGGFLNKDDLEKTHCGAGKMIAVGPEGNLYPCIRYKDYSLNENPEWLIGKRSMINMEMVRPFAVASNNLQLDEECLNCPVANGCGQCQGYSYDVSDGGTNYQKAKFICKMHMARVRANNYYFARLQHESGIYRQGMYKPQRNLYILLSENFQTYCCYDNSNAEKGSIMKEKQLEDVLVFCEKNFYTPILIHPSNDVIQIPKHIINSYNVSHIVSAKYFQKAIELYPNYDVLCVFDGEYFKGLHKIEQLDNCILNICAKDIAGLSHCVSDLLKVSNRINVNILHVDASFNMEYYRKQLLDIEREVVTYWNVKKIRKEINCITDLSFIKEPDNCKAGDRSLVCSPDGRLHSCVGLYRSGSLHSVGDIKNGLLEVANSKLYKRAGSPICLHCDTYQCKNCIYINKSSTNEINVPPSFQCYKSHIEREVSYKFQREVLDADICNQINPVSYRDPIYNTPQFENTCQTYYFTKGKEDACYE